MTEIDRLKIEYSKLLGEYTGTLKGILYEDISPELKEKLKKNISKLERQGDGLEDKFYPIKQQ